MDYIKFLTSFLHDHGLTVDVNDYIRYSDEARTPILVDGRRLALPTERHRRSPADDTILFHPLAENTVADLTPTMKEIMRWGSINLNILFATYGVELIQVASDQGRQVNLTDGQIDLLAKLKSCKSSSEKNVAKVAGNAMLNHSERNPSTAFIQMGLTRGHIYRGEKRHRACSVSFPMYEQLLADAIVPKAQAKFDLTKDVRDTLIELHTAFFPAVDEKEAYGYADVTNRTIAPFFTTYALSYAQLACEFKARCKTLQGLVVFTAADEPPDLDWVKDLQNSDVLQKWAISIPDQSSLRVSADTRTEHKVPEMQAATPAPEKKVPDVPFVGQRYVTATGAIATAPPPPEAPKVSANNERMRPDEFLQGYSTPNAFSAVQMTTSMLKDYIAGYGKFWNLHIERFRVAPSGMPHPSQVPSNMLPPAYPEHPMLPHGFFPGGPLAAQVVPGMMNPHGAQMPYGVQHPSMHPHAMAYQPYGSPYGQPQGYPPAGYPVAGTGYPAPYNGGFGNYGGAVVGNGGASTHSAFAGTAISSGTVSAGTI